MNPIELRPRGVGEILDAAFKLYTRNFKTLITLAAVVLIPIGLVQLVISGTLGNVDLFDALVVDGEGFPPGLGRLLAATVIVSLLGGIGALLVQGASVKVFADAYQGTQAEWRESLGVGARKALLILVAALLTAIGSGLGLLFCIVPGVWLWTSWYVTIPSLVVEDLGPIQSMARSFRLVAKNFWPVLGVGVLAWLLTAVVNQVVGLIVNLAVVVPNAVTAPEIGPQSGTFVATASLAALVVSIFTVPFLAAVAVAVYFDLRVRSEGYDLELLAREVGDSPSSPPAPPPPPPPGRTVDEADPDDPFGIGRA